MPMDRAEHGHDAIEAFLWGLLPDSELVVDRWAARFGVSGKDSFGLLSHVGEDCAGAVQFLRPDRLDQPPSEPQWLTENAIADRLRALRADAAASRLGGDAGRFTLAGVQPKTALVLQGKCWGVPSGRTPTTHLLKPPMAGLEGLIENECLCLGLARALGLPAAQASVMRFQEEWALVVERFDRAGGPRRLHQEDLCQALGLLPTRKYQSDGGPGPRDIVELLRAHSAAPDEDVAHFLDGLAFSWLTAGIDAHAKNYSLFIGSGGQVRLAPLYDLSSITPYAMDPKQVRLAMTIGGEYRLEDIRQRQWHKLAAELRIDADALIERIDALASLMPDALAQARDGLDHPIIDRLAGALAARAQHCRQLLGTA